jgi:hypothetical protein
MSNLVLGLVEIGDDPMILLIGGVFIVTFLVVCLGAYLLLPKRRPDAPATTLRQAQGRPEQRRRTTWGFQLQSRLPVSKQTFEQIAQATAAATARPQIRPATRAQPNQLDTARAVFVSIYRVLMITVGLAGLVAAFFLIRSHTSGNQQGLPGAIILLFSLGALLKGLVPGPSIVSSVEPLDSTLLDQLKQKIDIQVITSQPLAVTMSESDIRLAAEMLRRGAPIADVARAVHPGYTGLSDADKRSIESAIARATGGRSPQSA